MDREGPSVLGQPRESSGYHSVSLSVFCEPSVCREFTAPAKIIASSPEFIFRCFTYTCVYAHTQVSTFGAGTHVKSKKKKKRISRSHHAPGGVNFSASLETDYFNLVDSDRVDEGTGTSWKCKRHRSGQLLGLLCSELGCDASFIALLQRLCVQNGADIWFHGTRSLLPSFPSPPPHSNEPLKNHPSESFYLTPILIIFLMLFWLSNGEFNQNLSTS